MQTTTIRYTDYGFSIGTEGQSRVEIAGRFQGDQLQAAAIAAALADPGVYFDALSKALSECLASSRYDTVRITTRDDEFDIEAMADFVVLASETI